MKIGAGLSRYHYAAGVGIFMTMVVLTAGMMGCDDDASRQYDLTISSTEGGSVITPGEETFAYNKTTVVSLVAEPDHGYQFIKWTGNVGSIEDVNGASTNITMNSTCSITAIFAKEVRDWNDLDAIKNNLGGSYILMNNLDSSSAGYYQLASPIANEGQGWQPIGGEDRPFTGSLCGQGHQISDLFIDRPDESEVGLFAFIGKGGAIENIGLVEASVTGYYCVGGVVGYSKAGTVTGSYSTGGVKGYMRVGGLVGWNQGTVSRSYSAVRVTYARSVGGLVGYNTGTVSNSYSAGSATGFEYVGGLIGTNHIGGGVDNCYSSTKVTYELPPKGGLVGVNYMFLGGVRGSFWDTQASRQDDSAGGTGKTTTQMKNVDTFLTAGWNITSVVNPGTRDPSCIWNIVDGETYPFLSWEPIS